NSGAPFQNDFIELHNRTGVTIDLTGWSVQYASATGTTWSKTDLTGTIAAGQYYLIQEASSRGVGAPLPSPAATGTTAQAASAGKVALVNRSGVLPGSCPSAGIVDFVGYGSSADCYEGPGPAPAPGNTTSVQRDSNGCRESGNNSVDFLTGSPAPRNTQAAS